MALADVSDLYDKYFQSAIPESDLLNNKDLLITIGIISFFFSLNLDDEEFCNSIYKDFGINSYVFKESIEKLERFELVESSIDYRMVRISEQVLSTYFFYKTFFKVPILDFKILLNNYFNTHTYRFSDTIIPANNTFGYDNVYQKVTPYLTDFWNLISTDEDQAFKYLNLFWFYKQDIALAFVNDKIADLPKVKNPIYNFNEKNQSTYDKDRYIDLLSKFYNYPAENLIDAVALGFDLCKLKPNVFTQLLQAINNSFIFSFEDEQTGFYRQTELWKLMRTKIFKGDKVYATAFFKIAQALMKASFNVTSGGRKRNTISYYTYNILLSPQIQNFRKTTWDLIEKLFEKEAIACENFIIDYLENSSHKTKPIFKYDLTFLIKIFKNHFKTEFIHCYIIHKTFTWAKQKGIKSEALFTLKQKFINTAYKYYCLLSNDRLIDKYEHEYNFDNLEEYGRLKEEEIRKNLIFNDLKQFKEFYKVYLELSKFKEKRNANFSHSLDVLLDENIIKSPTNGVTFIKEIINHGNKTNYIPWRPLQRLLGDKNISDGLLLLQYILKNDFVGKEHWLLIFFNFLPEKYIGIEHVKIITGLFENIKSNHIYVELSFLKKFATAEPNIFQIVLQKIIEKNEEGKVAIQLDQNFFNEIPYQRENLSLVKRCYLQQEIIQQYFDYNFNDFYEILKLDNGFLQEYIDFISRDKHGLDSREYNKISIVWRLSNAEEILEKLFDKLSDKSLYNIKEDFANAFFDGLDDTNRSRALVFLKKYLLKNKSNAKRINTIFDCIRHSFKDSLSNFIKYFLMINPRIEDFKKIDFIDNYFFGKGETIWAEVRAAELEEILKIINQIKKEAYRYAKHKEYLLLHIINEEKRQADRERKRKFMNPDW